MHELGGEVKYSFQGFHALALRLPEPAIQALLQTTTLDSIVLSRNLRLDGNFKNYSYWIAQEAGHGFKDIPEMGGMLKLGIIDTGVDCNHPDLVCRLGYSFTDRGPWGEDDCDHGTPVYSVANAQRTGDNGYPHGYAPGADTRMYRADVLEAGRCRIASALAASAVDYATFTDHVHAISMSFSGENPDPALAASLRNASDAGIFLVASAGNTGRLDIRYPAAQDEVMAISGLQCDEGLNISSSSSKCGGDLQRWSGTSFGLHVELAAIAREIEVDVIGGGTMFADGNSLSTPTVAAAGVLIMERWPNSQFKIDAIREHLKHTAYRGGHYSRRYMGSGSLDIRAAILEDPCGWQQCKQGRL